MLFKMRFYRILPGNLFIPRLFAFVLASMSCLSLSPSFCQSQQSDIGQKIDSYIDARFESPVGSTRKLLKELETAGLKSLTDLARALRAPRASYPDSAKLVGKYTKHSVKCYHVDYQSNFLLFVPENYKPGKRVPLVVVGHGGNSSMNSRIAEATANAYLKIYSPAIGKNLGAIVVAPVSERGWGHIGNSLIFSTISKLTRMFSIDPDRIYITGQSMGGHLAYRAALSLPDRWGAVSPHSGGYDFVAKKSIGNLRNVPGLAIFGKREPYGINTDNKANAKWAKSNGLNWKFIEKNGGHTIYRDELPNVAQFFKQNPRNLYRDTVYMRQGGAMKFVKTWGIKGWPEHKVYSDKRPLRWNIRHWIEIEPRPDLKEPLEITATNKRNNDIEIASKNVRKLTIYLHPKMVDFGNPIAVKVNGEKLFDKKVATDPKIMFELAREFDDRGRIFWAKINLKISTDSKVEIPKKKLDQ